MNLQGTECEHKHRRKKKQKQNSNLDALFMVVNIKTCPLFTLETHPLSSLKFNGLILVKAYPNYQLVDNTQEKKSISTGF